MTDTVFQLKIVVDRKARSGNGVPKARGAEEDIIRIEL